MRLFLPYPAMGHALPMLDLARRMSRSGASTAKSVVALSSHFVSKLRAQGALGADDDDALTVIRLQDGIDDSIRLSEAKLDLLNASFAQLFAAESSKYTELVVETFTIRAMDIAPEALKAKAILFSSQNSIALLDQAEHLLPDHKTPCFPRLGPKGFLSANNSPVVQSLMDKFIRTVPGHTVLLNACENLETQWLTPLRSYFSESNTHNIRTVGPLFPKSAPAPTDSVLQDWLSRQDPASVVYVSMGSTAQADLPASALLALHDALDGYKYIWSLAPRCRALLESALDGSVLESSPDRLILDWAPQRWLLLQPAVAAFITHAGWGSVMEAVAAGVPCIAMPRFSDQTVNAALTETLGTGMVIPGTLLAGENAESLTGGDFKSALAFAFDPQTRATAEKVAKQAWNNIEIPVTIKSI